MANEKEVFWHLPGFCFFRLLNQVTINLMHDYPEKFKDGYKIGSVYGTFPGAIWNGGRSVFGLTCKSDMENMIKTYNSKGVPVRFTWTNSLLEEKHMSDTYCNLIMKVADNGMNQVLVNQNVLENYIRSNYPSYKIISSTTKRMKDTNQLVEELQKDYFLVVLDYDLNHNQDVLQKIHPFADKVEILVNEICFPECKTRTQHYLEQSRMQLEYDVHCNFQCPNKSIQRRFSECMKRPAFISNEQITQYIEDGYRNFKIVGRGLPIEFVKDSYLYFLVKEDSREFIQTKMEQTLTKLMNAQKTYRK